MNKPVTECLFPFPLCAEQLAAIPEFKSLGPLFKSSEPVQLTEAETEYFVRCIKHVFTNHIVFQVRVPHLEVGVPPCGGGGWILMAFL